MKQNQIALRLEEKNRDQVTALSETLEGGFKDNALFTDVDPPPADLTTARTALVAQNVKIEAARGVLQAEENKGQEIEDGLRTKIIKITGAANDMVDGDRAKLATANIPLRDIDTMPKKTGVTPSGMTGTTGDHAGEIDWACNAQGRNVTYIGEVGDAETGPYIQVYVGTRSRFTSAGHASGARKYGRMRAVKNGSASDFCPPTYALAH